MRYLAIFCMSLAFGYASDWSPRLISSLSESDSISLLGKLTKYEMQCLVPPTDTSICTHKYEIPLSEFRTHFPQKTFSFGVGTIFSASTFHCQNFADPIKTYDNPAFPGSSYDIHKEYQQVSIPPGCGNLLTIRAYSRPGARRTGYSSGILAVGTPMHVTQIKKNEEFYSGNIRLLIAFIILFSFTMSWFIKHSDSKMQLQHVEKYYFHWILFAIISSGLVQIFLPLMIPKIFTRLGAGFSIAAHGGPMLLLIIQSINEKVLKYDRQIMYGVTSSALLLAFSPYLFVAFGPICVALSFLCIVASLKMRCQLSFWFGVITFLNGLKILNVSYMPQSHVASIYVAMVFLSLSIDRIKTISLFNQLINWGRELSLEKVHSMSLQNFATGLSTHLQSGRVTILQIQNHGESNILIYSEGMGGNSEVQEFKRTKTPPVFAHVISNKLPIWHVDDESEEHRRLTQSVASNSKFNNQHYSLFPIFSENDITAVLAITDYKWKWDSEKQSKKFEASLEILSPYIASYLSRVQSSIASESKNEFLKIISDLEDVKSLIQTGSIDSIKQLASEISNCICISEDRSCFVAQVNAKTKQLIVLGTSGYPSEIENRLHSGTILVDSNNFHGPIPLSVNGNRSTFVTDINQISSAINPISYQLMLENKTKSFASIPVRVGKRYFLDSEIEIPWGIIWVESRIKDAISKSEVLMLEKISSRIASAISTYLEFERHREFRKTLTEFVPDSIVEKLMNGERGKVQETGYLLMVDLKDSSKIAQSISAEGWGEFVRDRVVPLIMPIAKQQGFQLHQVIWDAFYFTIPSMEQNENAINKLVLMHSAVRAEINKLYQVEFANIQNYELDPDVDKLRSCFVFGDTSRGFSESPTPVWTIVGFSMSHVSKLEAECKNFSGSLFTTNDFVKKYEILSTDCGLLPLTGETIAGIEQNKVFDLVV